MNSLTDEFVLLRTNAIQRKRFQTDQFSGNDGHDDESYAQLLRDEENGCNISNPPSFVGQFEALQYQMKRLEDKIIQIEKIQRLHVNRPTLDENSKEESDIRHSTNEITEMFSQVHFQLKSIKRHTLHFTGIEAILIHNIVSYLSNRMSHMTEMFQKQQGDYMKKLKTREEKSAQFFDWEEIETSTADAIDQQWSQNDQLFVEDNSRIVQLREKEIDRILQSIGDLNTIFKELATMVTEQGTIVDRIDYNIENTSIQVEKGVEQLKKAARYQKKDRKMYCIVILAVIDVILFCIWYNN